MASTHQRMSKLSQTSTALERTVDKLMVSYLLLKSEALSSDDKPVKLDDLSDDVLRKLVEFVDDDQLIELCQMSPIFYKMVNESRMAGIRLKTNIRRWFRNKGIRFEETNRLAHDRTDRGWKVIGKDSYVIVDRDNRIMILSLTDPRPYKYEIHCLTEGVTTIEQLSTLLYEHQTPITCTNQFFRIKTSDIFEHEPYVPPVTEYSRGLTFYFS